MSNSLYVAWRSGDSTHGRWGPVGRLDHDGGGYRFVYTHGANSLEGFSPFAGMPDLETVYESQELFPLFANRLLARSRPEYDAFLVWGGFDPNNPPDPIAVLGVTEGRRTTDSFEVFPCPSPDADGLFNLSFFVHGMRWTTPQAQEQINKMKQGDRLVLIPDDDNEKDRYAVGVFTPSKPPVRLGYVPRYLARDVRVLLESPDSIELSVKRINPHAPMQQRLLCQMKTPWPDEFSSCREEAYQPIPADVPEVAA